MDIISETVIREFSKVPVFVWDMLSPAVIWMGIGGVIVGGLSKSKLGFNFGALLGLIGLITIGPWKDGVIIPPM